MIKLGRWEKLIILILLSFVFYWFEWRPVNIVKKCSQTADIFAEKNNRYGSRYRDDFDYHFKQCLRWSGINE